jgi:catalase
MHTVPREIQMRQVPHFARADREYGARVAKALGLPEPLVERR